MGFSLKNEAAPYTGNPPGVKASYADFDISCDDGPLGAV